MTLLWPRTNQPMIFKFTPQTDINTWRIVNDGVMGGRSSSTIELTPKGTGLFKGTVSLENNGGFASVRHQLNDYNVSAYKGFKIRLKGDGKRYQFRVKAQNSHWHSYMTYLQTSNEWEEYDVPFESLSPTFRGRSLDLPNFEGNLLNQVGFLIANKKAEKFQLEIGSIALQ